VSVTVDEAVGKPFGVTVNGGPVLLIDIAELVDESDTDGAPVPMMVLPPASMAETPTLIEEKHRSNV